MWIIALTKVLSEIAGTKIFVAKITVKSAVLKVWLMSDPPMSQSKILSPNLFLGRFQGFTFESLQSRRETACIKLACKLLAGKGRGSLADFAPSLVEVRARSRHQVGGLQLNMPVAPSKYPLECFKRSFLYRLPDFWAALPQPLVKKYECRSWLRLPDALRRAGRSLASDS